MNFEIITSIISVITCTKPTISGGTVTPASTVGYGESYTVECKEGHIASGDSKMTCVDVDTFNQTPTCSDMGR